MKIGILTFHCAHNYGAVLQAFALQEYIKDIGHEVEVIDYRPQYLTDTISRFPFIKRIQLRIKSILIQLIKRKYANERKRGFIDFQLKYLNISDSSYPFPFPTNYDYDLYVIGSDQVWNTSITNGYDPIFFGEFIVKKGAQIISYAASMPSFRTSEAEKELLIKYLNNFSAISVREASLAVNLQPLYANKISIVLDPTLLLPTSFWYNLVVDLHLQSPYLLMYAVANYQATIELAYTLAQEVGLKLVVICGSLSNRRNEISYITPNPQEFVSWFKNAEFIVTSSFHGTAFSLIFKRSFYSVLSGNDRDERQITLLNEIGLIDRVVYRGDSPTYKQVNYLGVDEKINNLRSSSQQYLSDSINLQNNH